MKFVIPTQEELGRGLRALKTIALIDGELHETERSVIVAAQRSFGDSRDIDDLEPIDPEQLAAGMQDPAKRHQLLGGMIMLCMADGEVNEKEAKLIAEYAAALQIDDSAIGNLRRLAKGHNGRARLDILRRQWAVRKLEAMAEVEGKRVYVKAILGLLRLRRDEAMIAKYRAFEAYPAGSLGRAYFDYMIGNGFTFPGDKGSPPEAMLFHDFSHILSGYSTQPEEEILVATFSAGYSSTEVLNWFMFVLSQFQLGLQTAPNVPPATMKMDPQRMIASYRRGAAMNLDLNEGWDFWPLLDQPLEELRVRYNILPEADFATIVMSR